MHGEGGEQGRRKTFIGGRALAIVNFCTIPVPLRYFLRSVNFLGKGCLVFADVMSTMGINKNCCP